ncbi:hypothetical protein M422DRAFT_45181 [Sphaerobolus stellatus SS14]|nr:hypothetical protein M422DRAFT_45181 [Sphaerobolus stellatus SS14]
MERMDKAAKRLYKPRSFDEHAYHLVQLLRILGGNTAAQQLHNSMEITPSVCSLRRHSLISQLTVSVQYPTVSEIIQNICSVFPAALAKGENCRKLGYVVMIDEIATES